MAVTRKHLIAVALGAAAIGLVVAAWMMIAAPILSGLLFSAVSTPHIVRTDHPLSLAEVKIEFPFPATATNIQYAEYQAGIAYDFVLRFEAPKEDCLATVSKAVAAFKSDLSPAKLAELSQIQPLKPERDHVRRVDDLEVPWFDPENIQEGVEAGERGSHQPRIWIDTARGVFYFQYTD
jgi:hypothetical protein